MLLTCMASEWVTCPLCGKPVAVTSVPWPGQPVELELHMKEHGAPSDPASGGPGETTSAPPAPDPPGDGSGRARRRRALPRAADHQ